MKRRYLINIVLSFLLRILLYTLTCHLSRSSRHATFMIPVLMLRMCY